MFKKFFRKFNINIPYRKIKIKFYSTLSIIENNSPEFLAENRSGNKV